MARADRRQQLLQIARQLVAKEGMGALTMMALSERAKVAKPVVYSHFPNRAAVAIALLDEHFEAVVTHVRTRLADASTLEDYFSRLVDASFEFESPSETPVRNITNGFSAGDEVNQAFLRHEEAFRKHWEQLLEQFGVRRAAVPVVAYALSIMMDNTVYTFAILPQRKVARETLKAMLLAALNAVVPRGMRKLQVIPFADPHDGKRSARGTRGKARGPSNRAGASTKTGVRIRLPFAAVPSRLASERRKASSS
jgi:AcrR family transcriptional regulator